MSYPNEDTSLDNYSHPEIDCEEFKLDLHSLIEDDIEVEPIEQQSQLSSTTSSRPESPQKRRIPTSIPISNNLFSLNTPNLQVMGDHSVTNELFQVTHNLRGSSSSPPRKKVKQYDLFGNDEDMFEDIFSGKRLNNSKIDKLVQELEQKIDGDDDYEMDDQVRTRIYKGRFRPLEDDMDSKIGVYLDENKENMPQPDPLKSVRNLENNSIKKSGKVFFKTPRRKKDIKSFIPVLKPLNNVTNVDLRINDNNNNNNNKFTKGFPTLNPQRSPKRICIPSKKWNSGNNLKPSIKYKDTQSHIYFVDSSTGLINDATQFGTELNASNCEGFLLPEDTNEIVQIPTNDDTIKSKQKMAIIKAFHNKYSSKNKIPTTQPFTKAGFYTKEEFEKFINNSSKTIQTSNGVEVVQSQIQSPEESTINSTSNSTIEGSQEQRQRLKVRWADQLEW
ncbi:hypothetical protein CAAN1_10S03730 [[Candida] anglica]|uniref:Uncharacterized protein n=1 Tax=[Candida] anglica TaxID=148631 RepID=A0ABP0EHF7_9ASCO